MNAPDADPIKFQRDRTDAVWRTIQAEIAKVKLECTRSRQLIARINTTLLIDAGILAKRAEQLSARP